MDFGKGDMYDFLVSAMIKNDKFDDFLESEKELKKVQPELDELGLDPELQGNRA